MFKMSRRSRIIELALAKSEIIDQTDSNTGEKPSENVEPPPPAVFMETGNDLLSFKYHLRQRSPIKNPDVQNETVTDETEEIYSPVVSEYLPPECKASVLTPDADTESLNEQLLDQSFDDDDCNIEQTLENTETVNCCENRQSIEHNSRATEIQTNEEPPMHYIESLRTDDIETEPSLANTSQKKKYPKKVNAGRKRILNKENWKNSITKKKKNLGQEFVNKIGRLIPKKEMKPSCDDNCSRKCSEKITENQRYLIFKDFWALGDHNKQMEYVSRFVKRVPKKLGCACSTATSRRKWSLEYFLFVGEEIRTCKTMFLNTLSISDMWVQTLFKKIDKSGTGSFAYDQRGTHRNRKNAIPVQVKQSIRDHISQIPVVDSHCVRKRSSKLYLDEQLNMPKLHQLYLEWMKEVRSDQVEIATIRQYREVFCTEHNMDFNKPKKDQCPRCDIFKNANSNEKIKLEYEQALHIANKNIVRLLKESDKQRAKQSNDVVTACYDLQKILNTPQSEVSIFYYKRKLAAYNFTIYDMGKNKGHCYFWDETIGRKGSNEISSFVFDFIKIKVEEGFKEFNFYSDSCGGQNKNRIVFAMYAYAAKTLKITINHHFFEVGHSQSEGDAMHALIERRKKNKVIYTPQQWVTLIRCAKSTGEPYVVTEVNQDLILDFKQLIQNYNNWENDMNNQKVAWSKIMHIRCARDQPSLLVFQYDSLCDNEMTIDLVGQRGKRATRRTYKGPQNINHQDLPHTIPKAYNGPLPLTAAKYKDLMSLCKSNAIPEMYRDYYFNLPHSNSSQKKDNSDSD